MMSRRVQAVLSDEHAALLDKWAIENGFTKSNGRPNPSAALSYLVQRAVVPDPGDRDRLSKEQLLDLVVEVYIETHESRLHWVHAGPHGRKAMRGESREWVIIEQHASAYRFIVETADGATRGSLVGVVGKTSDAHTVMSLLWHEVAERITR